MKLDRVAHWWTWNIPLPTAIMVVTGLGLAPLLGWALAAQSQSILGLLIIVLLAPVIVRWPVISTFGLYVFLVPFDSISTLNEMGGASLTKLLGLLAGAVFVIIGLMERRLRPPPLAALWWGLLVAWSALTALWAINPENVFAALPTVLSLFILYVTAVSIRPSRQELYWVCALLVIAGSLAAAEGYLYGVTDAARPLARGRLAIGDRASNPNTLGAVLILPFALAIAGFIGLRGTVPKAMAGGCVGLIGLGIYISSRGAVVGLITTMAVLLYRLRVRWQMLVVILTMVGLVAAMPGFSTRMTRVFTGEDATGSGRTEIWKVGLRGAETFGVIGAGLWNFVEVHSMYAKPMRSGTGAHNTYLNTWVELGIIGLALMLAALGSHLFAAHKAREAGRNGVVLAALEAACFGVLASGAFGDNLWTKNFWLAWMLHTWATYCEESQTHMEGGHPRGNRRILAYARNAPAEGSGARDQDESPPGESGEAP